MDIRKIKIECIQLTDSQLVSNINQYVDKNLFDADFEHVLVVKHTQKNSEPYTEVYYEMNLETIMEDLPPFYTTLDGRYIFIHSGQNAFPVIDRTTAESVLNKVFSIQYPYYKENGAFPVLITFGCEKWKFRNNKFVDREVY